MALAAQGRKRNDVGRITGNAPLKRPSLTQGTWMKADRQTSPRQVLHASQNNFFEDIMDLDIAPRTRASGIEVYSEGNQTIFRLVARTLNRNHLTALFNISKKNVERKSFS